VCGGFKKRLGPRPLGSSEKNDNRSGPSRMMSNALLSMDLRTTFAANVVRLWRAKGLSQEALAHEAGVNRSYLARIETGRHYVVPGDHREAHHGTGSGACRTAEGAIEEDTLAWPRRAMADTRFIWLTAHITGCFGWPASRHSLPHRDRRKRRS
jgi:hypothetical protein